MNVGLYQGATALDNLEKWQDVIAQNIASSSVPGYKGTQFTVSGMDYGSIQDATGVSSSSQAATMPMSGSTTTFLPGTMTRTSNPTDVAVDNGFFVAQRPDGSFIYTRNGQFNVSPTGQLTTSSGNLVQGTGGVIQLIQNGQEISIGSSGEIRQGQQLVGKLKVVNFADTSALTRVAGGFSASDDGLAKPILNYNVSQGYLEESNVSAVNEMVKMIEASRAQEANQKVIQNYDNRLTRTIQTFTRNS